MGKMPYLEPTILSACAVTLLASSVGVVKLHHASATWRVVYGMEHLAPALLCSGLFFCVLALAQLWLRRDGMDRLERLPAGFFLAAIGLAFCVFWLPVVVWGGFAQDDWLLLAAASIRHVIPAHPVASWVALDSVDGNFRPLGTVLYFGYMYKAFGLAPHLYLMANFLLNLGTAWTGFLIVRGLGYSKLVAGAGAVLYLSRGVLYTQAAWVSALGDCIVTLLTGVVILLLLRAIRYVGWRAIGFHGAAWALFAVSTLAKQSSFTTPAIVVALLLLRPGPVPALPWGQRAKQAGVAGLLYGGVVVAVYLHARALLGHATPYQLKLSFYAVLRTFAYVFWYFETLYIPNDRLFARSHPAGLFDLGGMVLVLCVGVLLYRRPGLLGERPKDLLFLLIAGLSSVSLFVMLEGRNEAYYGSMLAFWFSLGFAILLTRVRSPGPRRLAHLGVLMLVGVGFLDVRMKEIGLLWTGGYFWGDADVQFEGARFAELQRIAAADPQGQTAVLIDPPIQPRFYTAMLFLLAPQLEHVLVYDSKSGTYLGNDRQGGRPEDGIASLRDVEAYRARLALSPAAAAALTSEAPTVWIRYRDGQFVANEPSSAQARR